MSVARALAAALVATTGCAFQPSGLGDPTDDGAVTDGPGADARTPDALPPDAAACPSEYRLVRGAYYRLPSTSSSVVLARADCEDDLAERTHLATFENSDLDGVLTELNVPNNDSVHVGATCTATGLDCDVPDVWRWSTDSPVAATLWQDFEPRGGWDHAFATRTAGTWGLVSGGTVTSRRFVCECEP